MRLLNVHTFRLEDEYPEDAKYAILSHRWEDEEVVYADVKHVEDDTTDVKLDKLRKKMGFAKVEGACNQAAQDDYDYIWIDSCCIDKSNSAELSKSINSMYSYYKQANVCYAFLGGLEKDPAKFDTDESFETHRWFTRGWTLQELIAPKKMEFFTDEVVGKLRTSNWIFLADKKDIYERLSAITNIDVAILSHEEAVTQASVAKRMSWTSMRTTKEPEDHAYSLMGLFGVNMPMLYGEGKAKAFLRLQEEIMKVSSDQSIFAWRDTHSTPGTSTSTGILATSPEVFKDSWGFFSYSEWDITEPFIKTNRGLQITLPLRLVVQPDIFVAALNCPQPNRSDGFAGIYLRAMPGVGGQYEGNLERRRYERVQSDEIVPIQRISDRGDATTITVRADSGSGASAPMIYPNHIIQLGKGPDPKLGLTLYGTMGIVSPEQLVLKNTKWIPPALKNAFQLPKERYRLAAVVVFARPDQTKVTVLLGSSNNMEDIGIRVVNGYSANTFGEWAREFQREMHDKNHFEQDLGRELFKVDINWQAHYFHKYYVADFIVEPKSKDKKEEEEEAEEVDSDYTISQVTDRRHTPERSWKFGVKRMFRGSKAGH